MKKLVYIILMIFSFFFVWNTYAETWNLNTETWTLKSENKISFTYYYWEWCSHCAALNKYLEKNNAYNILGIEKKEVWSNKENNEEMLAAAKRLWVDENSIWVPLFLVKDWENEKILVWDTDIISYLKPYLLWSNNEETSNSNKKVIVFAILGALAIWVPISIIKLNK